MGTYSWRSLSEAQGDRMVEIQRVEHHAEGDLQIEFHGDGSATHSWLTGCYAGCVCLYPSRVQMDETMREFRARLLEGRS
jgi:hypothetical protein